MHDDFPEVSDSELAEQAKHQNAAELESILDHLCEEEKSSTGVHADQFLQLLQTRTESASNITQLSTQGTRASYSYRWAAAILLALCLSIYAFVSLNEPTEAELDNPEVVAILEDLELLESLDGFGEEELNLLRSDEWIEILDELNLLESVPTEYWEN